jgi:hypothetical protein
MARPLWIEYAGAIYHVMSRGNARQAIFEGEGDYERLRDGLPAATRKKRKTRSDPYECPG